jgi:hypothetical protein
VNTGTMKRTTGQYPPFRPKPAAGCIATATTENNTYDASAKLRSDHRLAMPDRLGWPKSCGAQRLTIALVGRVSCLLAHPHFDPRQTRSSKINFRRASRTTTNHHRLMGKRELQAYRTP